MILECGCCGKQLKGKQFHEFDKGYGRCLSCLMEWFVRMPDERLQILEAIKGQWPEAWGFK